jgi:hypothetical protein
MHTNQLKQNTKSEADLHYTETSLNPTQFTENFKIAENAKPKRQKKNATNKNTANDDNVDNTLLRRKRKQVTETSDTNEVVTPRRKFKKIKASKLKDRKITNYFSQKKASLGSLAKNIDLITTKVDKLMEMDIDSTYTRETRLTGKTEGIIKTLLTDETHKTNYLNIPNISKNNNIDNLIEPPKLSKSSLAILDKTLHKIQGSSIPNNNLLQKSSPKKQKLQAKDILNKHSIKDKYEALLKNELIIPCHYQEIFTKFLKLDQTIQTLGLANHKQTFSNIQNYFQLNFKEEITIEDFQMMLYVAPHFYIYKWERVDGKIELIIDIPVDIEMRMKTEYQQTTDFVKLQTYPFIPLKSQLSEAAVKKRNNTF